MATSATKKNPRLRTVSVQIWKVGGKEFEQDPLTFFEKNEFFALVSRLIERAVEQGLDARAILELIGTDDATLRKVQKGEMDFTMLPLATSIVGIIGKLGGMAADILEEAYMIFLSVPLAERFEARDALRQMDDETGFSMLETFIEQNAESLKDFLPRWGKLFKTASQTLRPSTSEG